MVYVVMENSGGELDRREVTEGRSPREVLISLLYEVENLYDGDVFRVEDPDDSLNRA